MDGEFTQELKLFSVPRDDLQHIDEFTDHENLSPRSEFFEAGPRPDCEFLKQKDNNVLIDQYFAQNSEEELDLSYH